jgi:Protein of unknown function (DUF2384)
VSITDDPQVERVLQAVEAISGDHDRAVAWLQEPLATFDGKTALELVTEGRTDDLLGYLASFEPGFVG